MCPRAAWPAYEKTCPQEKDEQDHGGSHGDVVAAKGGELTDSKEPAQGTKQTAGYGDPGPCQNHPLQGAGSGLLRIRRPPMRVDAFTHPSAQSLWLDGARRV